VKPRNKTFALFGCLFALVLFLFVLFFLFWTPAPMNLSIRLSGVSTNTTPKGSAWRVEVPKPNSQKDAVLFWTVWIQETNRPDTQPRTLQLSAEENDLLNRPISGSESGIITWSGPMLASGMSYRAVGAYSVPEKSNWRIRVYQSPFRPLLRFVPEPRRTFATSDWVQVSIPKQRE
jgi:hypothetical protein